MEKRYYRNLVSGDWYAMVRSADPAFPSSPVTDEDTGATTDPLAVSDRLADAKRTAVYFGVPEADIGVSQLDSRAPDPRGAAVPVVGPVLPVTPERDITALTNADPDSLTPREVARLAQAVAKRP